VEHCERVQIIAASKRICIANCRECTFYLGVNNQPLIVGDNHKLQVSFALPIRAFLTHQMLCISIWYSIIYQYFIVLYKNIKNVVDS
jgi:hypothetical protein